MILLVVDMQKGIVDEELYAFDLLMENTVRLIGAARESGVEVVYVQHDAGPGSGLTAGDEGFQIDDRVRPAPGEKVFVKTINSCFGNKDFKAYMERQADKRLMVVGLQTNYCIDATVKSAFERGFTVIVPAGTNSTFDNDYMSGETAVRYYNEDVWEELVDAVTVEEAVELLRGAAAGTPPEAPAPAGLRLERITWDNEDAVLKLRVKKEQKTFVASNRDSLVHAYLAITADGKQVFPFGIYLGKKPVGFIMIAYDFGEDDGTEPRADWFLRNSYYIWRFMIDKRYQGNGYGRAAMELALEFIRTFPAGAATYCWLSYEPENETAKKLYHSFGFEDRPEQFEEGGEMPAVLKL